MICAGGPPASMGGDIILNAAHKNGSVWRHNDCSFLLQDSKSCMKCISVSDLLRKKVDYSKTLQIRINMLAKIQKGRGILRKQKQLEELGTT